MAIKEYEYDENGSVDYMVNCRECDFSCLSGHNTLGDALTCEDVLTLGHVINHEQEGKLFNDFHNDVVYPY